MSAPRFPVLIPRPWWAPFVRGAFAVIAEHDVGPHDTAFTVRVVVPWSSAAILFGWALAALEILATLLGRRPEARDVAFHVVPVEIR